jgi:hypothetical protein
VLKPRGIAVLTLLSKSDSRFTDKRNIKVAPDTFIQPYDPDEAGVPHYYCGEKTVKELFSDYNFISLEEYNKMSERRNALASHWYFILEKK